MNNTYYTLEWYEGGEYYGFNKFYSLKAARAFIRITARDRLHRAEKTGKEITYKIIKKEG